MASFSSSDLLILDLENQTVVLQSLEQVESRVSDWLSSSKWKHYKTVQNEYLALDDKALNGCATHTRNIVVRSLQDPLNKKLVIWKITAFLPCDAKTAVDLYALPKYHALYDDNESMQKLERFQLSKMDTFASNANNNIYDMKVAVTNSRLNGWIKPRLCVGINCRRSDGCYFGTYLDANMLAKYRRKLLISDKEFKYTQSRNLNLYFTAKPCSCPRMVEVTYILQADNGGSLPKWAVDLGMVDQHLIAIFKQMTKYLNENPMKTDESAEGGQDCEDVRDDNSPSQQTKYGVLGDESDDHLHLLKKELLVDDVKSDDQLGITDWLTIDEDQDDDEVITDIDPDELLADVIFVDDVDAMSTDDCPETAPHHSSECLIM